MPETKQKFRHEIAESVMRSLPATARDVDIIGAHIDYLISRGPSPFVLRINHDARLAPCPVWRDWKKAEMSGATFVSPVEARNWIEQSMKLGYEVSRAIGRVDTAYGQGSITQIRRAIESRAKWEAIRATAKRNGLPDPDDEIPF